MSTGNKHIINKQVIELHMSEQSKAFEMQQAIASLYKNKFTSIINNALDNHFSNKKGNYQIAQLTLDLGKVNLENIAEKFSVSLQEAVYKVSQSENIKKQEAAENTALEKTPLKIIAYYISTGRMPWWATNTKAYLQQQLAILLAKPTTNFKQQILALQQQPSLLNRYVQSFPEAQLIKTFQLLVNNTDNEIIELKNHINKKVEKKVAQQIINKLKNNFTTHFTSAFYVALFQEYQATISIENFKDNLVKNITASLGVFDVTYTKQLIAIQTLLEKQKAKHKQNVIWQQFFLELQHLVKQPTITNASEILLTNIYEAVQLIAVNEKSIQKSNNLKTLKKITNTVLLPLRKQVLLLNKAIQKTNRNKESLLLKKEASTFEATDFITVENAGLVLLWPFLQRFFENLEVLENKEFKNEESVYKAIAALHYLCYTEDSEVFEGLLPLIKILCGLGIEDGIENYILSEDDKITANKFLEAVIQQGKSWGNISITGFRSSYLLRQASIRIREDHWLLQVEKQTYDILLQKLPWNVHAIKFPWMEQPIMVEWL